MRLSWRFTLSVRTGKVIVWINSADVETQFERCPHRTFRLQGSNLHRRTCYCIWSCQTHAFRITPETYPHPPPQSPFADFARPITTGPQGRSPHRRALLAASRKMEASAIGQLVESEIEAHLPEAFRTLTNFANDPAEASAEGKSANENGKADEHGNETNPFQSMCLHAGAQPFSVLVCTHKRIVKATME